MTAQPSFSPSIQLPELTRAKFQTVVCGFAPLAPRRVRDHLKFQQVLGKRLLIFSVKKIDLLNTGIVFAPDRPEKKDFSKWSIDFFDETEEDGPWRK